MSNFVTTERLQQFFNGLPAIFARKTHYHNQYLTSHQDISGKLDKSGGTLTGQLNSRNVIPTSNNTYNLGSSSAQFDHVYSRTINGGLNYQTTAPTSSNSYGLKIVVLSSEPSTKYSGYLYIITGW